MRSSATTPPSTPANSPAFPPFQVFVISALGAAISDAVSIESLMSCQANTHADAVQFHSLQIATFRRIGRNLNARGQRFSRDVVLVHFHRLENLAFGDDDQ